MTPRTPHRCIASATRALIFCCVGFSVAVAQNSDESMSRNSIYLEAGGPGALYSINYDFRFESHLGVRVGYSHWTFTFFGHGSFTGYPVMLNFLSGEESHHFEAGLGVVMTEVSMTDIFFTNLSAGRKDVFGTAMFGYRFQPQAGGIVFRAGLTPFYIIDRVFLWGGVSLGYSF